jgi:hypothetical protein
MYGLFDKTNEYDVSQYTEEELYKILDMNHPTDRELEAKLIGLVNKYNSYGNDTGDRIAQFYVDVYRRFFETEEDEDDNHVEGYTNMTSPAINTANPGLSYTNGATTINLNGTQPSANTQPLQTLDVSGQAALQTTLGTPQTFNLGNVLDTTTQYRQSDTLLTKPLDYTKDKLNPLLTQTVRRILSIDSQYRDNKGNTFSTEFTFNLSEPLRDVVALKLYSVGIPYSWYTISKAYGANFFYIKGNSPGIDMGDFDYKISVQPGNYDAPGLVNNLNTSIQSVISTYTDMSFGNTQVIYNSGSSSTTSGTGLSTIQIDMKKIFNESNYYLNFPTWTSTVNSSTSSPQLNSIPSYMGFNEQTYNGTSIFSTLFPGVSSTTQNQNQVFSVSATNSTFQIISYTGGNSLNTSTTIYNTIPISIDLGGLTSASYTRATLVTKLNDALQSNTTNLDTNYSALYWRDSSGVLQSYNQYSYMEMQIKLNPKIAPMVNNLKVAVAFPDVSSNPIFIGTVSCFRFSDQYETWTDPATNKLYYVNELSDLYSEVPILQSNYIPGNANVINFICKASGYDFSMNNYIIPMVSSAQYNLDDYLAFINTNIQTVSASTYHNEIYGSTGTQTQIRQDASSNILFDVHVKKIFTTNNYAVVATGNIAELFNMATPSNPNLIIVDDIYNLSGGSQVTAWDLSKSNVFSNNTYTLTSISFDASSTLQIYPQTNTMPPYNINVAGNKNARPFVVSFESGITFNNFSTLVTYLNTILTTFSVNIPINNTASSSIKTPFYNSSITYSTTAGYVLTLNVATELTQQDYLFDLTSAVQLVTDLSFNSTYSLIQYQNQQPSSLVVTVQNNTPKSDSLITIDASNNHFTFSPYNTIIGLQTTNQLYTVSITVANGIYNIKALQDAINAQLNANPISTGTVFSTYKKTDGSTYTKLRMNFNQVFSTKDFRLVFYDPYSFVTCTSGATQSIQNVTWDTTVGWILGFRQYIIYYLNDYVGYSYSYNTMLLNYYMMGSQSNVCVLISDTAANTNLYSYFLIVLDDYVQNHLNDGLVKITNQETNVAPEPHIMVCDPVTKKMVARPADFGSPGITYTENQLSAFTQKVASQQAKVNSYSKGPFVKDIFGFIPLKPGNIGSMYSEFGGTLQNQDRMYFGPVNIHRMTIRLLNDRGDLVDLNNNDWNFSLVCEQLYRN